ncbi:MAG: FecR domain-containing protein [Deltaproteobacteria bacterium]|nr:FecR domain-containing protein [Deltaproteobacteria bacterium]
MTPIDDSDDGCERFVRSVAEDLDGPGPAADLDVAARGRWVEAAVRDAAAVRCANQGPDGGLKPPMDTDGHRYGQEDKSGAAQRVGDALRPVRAGTTRRLAAVAAVVALAAGLAAVVILWPEDSEPDGGTAAPDAAVISSVAGDVNLGGVRVRTGDVVPPGAVVEVAEGRAALRLCGRAELTLGVATRLGVAGREGARCRVELGAGLVAVDAGGLDAGTSLVVSTFAGDVRVTGTVFAVEITGRRAEVRVLEGSVEVLAGGQPPRTVVAPQAAWIGSGEVRVLTAAELARDRRLADGTGDGSGAGATAVPVVSAPPVAAGSRALVVADVGVGSPVAPPATPSGASAAGSADPAAGAPIRAASRERPEVAVAESPSASGEPSQATAAELLDAARNFRAQGDWAAAAAAYEELTSRHPEGGEARVSLVPLGELRLERLGDPAGALRAFEEYLARSASGPLGEEASWGRVRALRGLERTAEEVEALRGFLSAHPASLWAREARERLAELEGGT